MGGASNARYLLRAVNSNDTDLMWVKGDGSAYCATPAWNSSDRRLKNNIVYFDNGLEQILKLKPAKFDYTSRVKNNIGFIAQDVQEIIPEAVTVVNDETGMLGMKSDFIIPQLVNAIKELKAQNDALELRLKALEQK